VQSLIGFWSLGIGKGPKTGPKRGPKRALRRVFGWLSETHIWK